MTIITFDTLLLVDKLKASGIPPEQAEAVVRVIAEAQTQLVTKTDLDIALASLRTDMAVMKWMMGVLGGRYFSRSQSLLLRFFGLPEGFMVTKTGVLCHPDKAFSAFFDHEWIRKYHTRIQPTN